ncbi:MAG: hypothetical protein OEX11_04565 [Nitrosomonas sp.]|nr:hypothetical protein [Nitrosomonas sp.]
MINSILYFMRLTSWKFNVSRFQMTISICGTCVCTAIILSGCAGMGPQNEAISGGFDFKEWKVGHEALEQNQMITEFVLPGEKIDNWSELFTIHTISKSTAPESIVAFVSGQQKELSKKCPTIDWNEIETQLPPKTKEESILYEWKTKNCPPDADQHEIVRVIYGKFNVFRLSYTAKTKALSPEKREKWIKALSEAETVKW